MAKLKLGTVGGQLISAWKSVPVWTSVAGSERLPGRAGGSCWMMGPCEFRLEPGLGQRPGEWFSMGETAKGSVGPDRGCSGRLWAKRHKGTSGNPLPNPLIVCNKFWRMDKRQKEKEKEREKEPAPGERTPKSDGSDTMVLNHGLGRFRNKALGLGRADHDQDLYGLDRFFGI
ncbi:hypothetical protein F2Q69_00037135 [Brassica cretica]|uniref:Uncharacterized protein n=1 Tax=Brassica cretica TaxID=69181 RepID=A0A8S9SFI0_BRACR|nr:hypothetical protein F2Q69_00037135 [Brassica cretica]